MPRNWSANACRERETRVSNAWRELKSNIFFSVVDIGKYRNAKSIFHSVSNQAIYRTYVGKYSAGKWGLNRPTTIKLTVLKLI